jgi:DNA-binding transcriptional LysR family regulator
MTTFVDWYHADISLSRREADLLIRECTPDGASLITRRLGDATYAVYGHRDLVAAHPAAQGEARYAGCPWVGFAEDRLFFPRHKSWLDERLAAAAAPPPRLRATGIETLLEAVGAGVGLGIVPCYFGDRRPDLVRLTAPIAALTSHYHLLIHRDVMREPAVRGAIDGIAALFRRLRPALCGEPATPLAAE